MGTAADSDDPGLLSPEQVQHFLAGHPAWTLDPDGTTIRRTVTAADFPAAIAAVTAVALTAEAADHHPDIDIRWRTLRFALSTHSAGGLTDRDVTLATSIDEQLTAGFLGPGS